MLLTDICLTGLQVVLRHCHTLSLLAIANNFRHSDDTLHQIISFVCLGNDRIGFSKKKNGLLPKINRH